MSLATDLLARFGVPSVTPAAPVKKPEPAKVQRGTYVKASGDKRRCGRRYVERPKTEGLRKADLPPGVSISQGNATSPFRAYSTQFGKMVNLGVFKSAERASLAYRLFSYWQRHGYEDAPRKPSMRLYTRPAS